MERHGPVRSTGAKGRSPDNAAAEGFFGRMKTESVHPWLCLFNRKWAV